MRGPFFAAGFPPDQLSNVLDHLDGAHPDQAAILHTGDAIPASALTARGIPTWIGGAYIPYTGPGTRYFEGMLNDNWRWASIVASVDIARSTIPFVEPAGWYITEENDLTGVAAHDGLRWRICWYLIELMRQLYRLRPVPFLWSPWASGPPRTAGVTAARNTLIAARDFLRSTGIPVDVELHFQDGVGAGHHTTTDAIGWGRLLKALPCPTAMNLELFRKNPAWTPDSPFPRFLPGDQAEILEREKLYVANGLDLGGLWEGRYWYYSGGWTSNHGGHP